jgi:hypothetical protein
MSTQTVRATVYKHEASLMETTRLGDADPSFLLGLLYVTARAGGGDHTWRPTGPIPAIGDVVTLEIEVDE